MISMIENFPSSLSIKVRHIYWMIIIFNNISSHYSCNDAIYCSSVRLLRWRSASHALRRRSGEKFAMPFLQTAVNIACGRSLFMGRIRLRRDHCPCAGVMSYLMELTPCFAIDPDLPEQPRPSCAAKIVLQSILHSWVIIFLCRSRCGHRVRHRGRAGWRMP